MKCNAPYLLQVLSVRLSKLEILLEIVKTHQAQLGRRDQFGQRYTVDFEFTWQNKSATLRSGWIIEHDSTVPKLTTCYPL